MSSKSFILREIRNRAAAEIYSVHSHHGQLNAAREALVSLIERIPVEQRTEAENALIAQHADIQVFRARSNELEALAEAAQSEQELAAIEISF